MLKRSIFRSANEEQANSCHSSSYGKTQDWTPKILVKLTIGQGGKKMGIRCTYPGPNSIPSTEKEKIHSMEKANQRAPDSGSSHGW